MSHHSFHHSERSSSHPDSSAHLASHAGLQLASEASAALRGFRQHAHAESPEHALLQPLSLVEHKPLTISGINPRLDLKELAKIGVLNDKTSPIQIDTKVRMNHLDAAVKEGSVQVLDRNTDRILVAPGSKVIAPDLVIKRDGTVELRNVPKDGPCLIQFEGNEKSGITQAQDRASKELSQWLGEHREARVIADRQAAAAQQMVSEINNRFAQPGSMSSRDASDYFPNRDQNSVARKENIIESSVLDMLAHMSGASKSAPYDSVRPTDQGFAVGRYGMTANVFWDWLSGLEEFADLGTPPDMSKLGALMAKLAKSKKVPAAFAENFKKPGFTEKFCQFMDKMQDGQSQPSKEEIASFMPKEMQEAVMEGVVEKASKQGTDSSVLALAMHLGKPVSKLSSEDLNNKDNRTYMEAANKVLGLAIAAHQAQKDETIVWDGTKSNNGKHDRRGDDENPHSELAFRIASAAEKNANNVGTVGWCYREVANTLDKFGVHLYGESAYMAAPQLAKNEHFKEISANGELKRGTILVFAPTANHPNGHITVYLGNGREASDHVQGLVNFNAYGGVRAFQPTA